MKWVGLTGGIASGKTTAAQALRRFGYPVIDADEIAKQVVAAGTEGLKKVAQAFGPGILNSDQSMDRKKIAAKVFSNPKDLVVLESIIHPLVQAEVLRQKSLEEKKGTIMAFYDVPLLYEKKLQKQFDCVLLISCSEELQRQRLRQRNQLNDQEIAERMQNQLPLREKEKLADFVVVNEGSLVDLEKKLKQVSETILAGPTNF